MFPNLLQATKEYWRQLDKLEVAYQQGEIPLEEVDAKVADLMAELAQERRVALVYLKIKLIFPIRINVSVASGRQMADIFITYLITFAS